MACISFAGPELHCFAVLLLSFSFFFVLASRNKHVRAKKEVLVAEVDWIFLLADANGDGVLDAEELVEALHHFGRPSRPEDWEVGTPQEHRGNSAR